MLHCVYVNCANMSTVRIVTTITVFFVLFFMLTFLQQSLSISLSFSLCVCVFWNGETMSHRANDDRGNIYTNTRANRNEAKGAGKHTHNVWLCQRNVDWTSNTLDRTSCSVCSSCFFLIHNRHSNQQLFLSVSKCAFVVFGSEFSE